MPEDELGLVMKELEELRRDNRLMLGLLYEIVAELKRRAGQPSLPAGGINVGVLKKVETVKKMVVKKLVVKHLDQLEYNLGNLDIKELSGTLNIGIIHKLKETRDGKSP